MSSELDSEIHITGCCCFACGNAEDPQESSGEIDPLQPVEQNAGGTSYPVSTVSGDGLQLGDYLLSGLKWNTTQLTFSFPDSMNDYEYSRSGTFEAFNTAQKAAAIYAFDMIEQYTTVQFTQLTGSQDRDADLRLAEESSASTAYAYYPSSSASGGDAWFNSTSYNSPVLGNYAFSTIMHEIGHAMGLKHGHESSFAGALPYEYDSHEYSVMTYRSYVGSPGTSYTDASDSGPQTFMMADIAALQTMYGANYATQSDNTVYTFDQTTGRMSINGVGQLDGSGDTIFRTIWDGNGVDTYDLSNFTANLAVDLRAGEGTDLDVGGTRFRADLGPNTSSTFNNGYARKHVYNALLANNDTRSLIENAIGGSGNDTFIGNQGNNRLDGGAGNDRFFDSAGSDTYIGGAGSDEVSFTGSFGSYSFTVGASFLEVIGTVVDYVYNTVERLLFSDRSWDYAALVGSLTPTNPDAIEDAFAVQESDAAGLAAIGSVLANDVDEGGLQLRVSAVNGQSAAVGSVITLASGASLKVQADGTVSYGQNGVFAGLDAGEKATDSFTYTITNGNNTDTATVFITIDGVPDPNLAPVAANDAFRGSEGAAIGGNVLANDSDPNGDSIAVTGVNGGALSRVLASGASVSMNAGGSFTYQQNGAFDDLELGQSTTDSFGYTITDAHGATSTATVTITVDGVADPNLATTAAFDIPGNTTSTATIGVGEVRTDTLEVAGDEDWFRLSLAAEQSVTIELTGTGVSPVTDPHLWLHDSTGTLVAFNDDGGPGRGSRIEFTAPVAGTWFVNAASYGGLYAGDYRLAVAPVLPAAIMGTNSSETLTGTAGDDELQGLGGNDELFGGRGNDLLFGGAGDDTLEGGAGADSLEGDLGIDTLSYAGSAAGIAISLQTGHARGGDAQGDQFTGFEGVLGSAHADAITGSFRDETIEGGAGGDTLQGAGGFDTLSYAGSTAGIAISLQTGHARGGDAQGDQFSGFEGVLGSAHADAITGSFRDETIEGGAGGDTLQGAGGFDTLSYAGSTAGIAISLQTGHARGGDAQGDQFSGFEGVLGSAHADAITGSFRDETIEGGAGDDALQGAGGFDTLSYAGSTAGIAISLQTGYARGGDAQGDQFTGFEGAIGSAHADAITGSFRDETIEGGAGGDTLQGAGGFDTLSYAGSTAGIAISLQTGHARGGDAQGDQFTGFEGAIGSAHADAITGSFRDETIEGGAGDDRIQGAGGRDIIAGGAGNDVLTGGAGSDRFVFDDGTGQDTIFDFTGDDLIDLTANTTLNSFADVQAAATQSGNDSVIDLGGGSTLTLTQVLVTSLTADEFLL